MATIEDVARLAGVSPSTASRVVGARHPVRETNRVKVMEAVRALNYVPNLAARSLASARHERIAVIYGDQGGAYLSAFLLGAMEAAADQGAELLLIRLDPGADPDGAQARVRLADGVITGALLPTPSQAAPLLETLKAMNIPTVAVGSGGADQDYQGVCVDDHAAAREMTERLLGLGHRRIGFITGATDQPSSRAREAGFREAINTEPTAVGLVVAGDFTFPSGLTASAWLLDQAVPPTAIFASNDDMAAAAISVAQRRQIDVPGQLTVVGFDDTKTAVTVWPPLTTVRQPLSAMAAASVGLLIQSIRAQRKGEPTPDADMVLPHAIIERQSAAPPATSRLPAHSAHHAKVG